MIKQVSSKSVYKNNWINVSEDVVVHPDGSNGLFGLVSMLDGVTVIPITNDKNFVLVEEYKYGLSSVSLEFISGGIEPNETPLNAAKRELKEEVGGVATEWLYLGYIDPFTSTVKSRNHMFVARDISFENASPDVGEVLNIKTLPLHKLTDLMLNNKITHGASVASFWKAKHYASNGHNLLKSESVFNVDEFSAAFRF